MSRVILHVDMDYFYAAIEERDNPKLKNKPIVICVYSGRNKDSGAVSTCNYIAREKGIRAGMSCKNAKSKLEDAEFLPMNKEYYTLVSDSLMSLIEPYADEKSKFEQVSVDECFLDITKTSNNNFESAFKTALTLKELIGNKEKLTCSIGIGPNKLLAKMASDFKKPNDITVITPEDTISFLDKMEVKKLWGIGKVTEKKLLELGIQNIGQISRSEITYLIDNFGKNKAIWLKNASLGIDNAPVKNRGLSNQISKIITLPKNSNESIDIIPFIEELAERIYTKSSSLNITFKRITFIAITANLKTYTKSKKINHPVNNKDILIEISKELVSTLLEENKIEIKRIGLKIDDLREHKGQLKLDSF